MAFPLWAVFGAWSAILSTALLLLQDRLKADGFALAIWVKVTAVLVTLPFIIVHGLPHNPLFFVMLGIGAVMYTISDVVFFRAVAKVGAGPVSRILPCSVILSFLLWFLVQPSLLDKYLASPMPSALILIVLCIWAYCATHLKKCAVTMQAVRALWFTLFAATVGPILAKTITGYADIGQGPYSYVFCEGIMMITIWGGYYLLRRPIPINVLFSRHSCTSGMIVGCVSAMMVISNITAYYYIDNPAYVPAIRYMDAILILGAYALMGRRSEGNIPAGLGLVACAIALIILRAQV